MVSWFLVALRLSHWDAAIHIIGCLERASGQCILFRNSGHLKVEGFTGANWAGSPSDRRSSMGCCIFLRGNLVTWKSKKQSVVAWSGADVEYEAMTHTASELTWFQHFLQELGFRR
jgi:hypothetical protein